VDVTAPGGGGGEGREEAAEDVDDDELRTRALCVPVHVQEGAFFLPDAGCRLSVRVGSVLAGHERGLNACLKDGCACEGVFYKEFNCLKSHLLGVVSLDVMKGARGSRGVAAAWKYLAATQPEFAISYNERLTDVIVSAATWVPARGAAGAEGAGAWHVVFRPTVDTDRLNAMCWARASVGANIVDSGVFEVRTKPSCWLVFEGVPLDWTAERFEAAVRETDAKGALVSTTLVRGDCSASGALGFAKYADRVRAGEACFAFLESPHASEQAAGRAGITVSLIRSLNRAFKRNRRGELELTGVRHPDGCRRGIVYAQVQVRDTASARAARRKARSLVMPRPARASKRAAGGDDSDSDSDDEEDHDDERRDAKRVRCVFDMVDPAEDGAFVAPAVPVSIVPRAMLRPVHLATSGAPAVWEVFPEDGAPDGGFNHDAACAVAARAGAGAGRADVLAGAEDEEEAAGGLRAALRARAHASVAVAARAAAARRDDDMSDGGGSTETEEEEEEGATPVSVSSGRGSLRGGGDGGLALPPVELGALVRSVSGASFADAGGVPSSFVAVLKARSVDLLRSGSISADFAKDLDALLDDPFAEIADDRFFA